MTDSRKQLFFILVVALGAFCLYGAIRFLTEDDTARLRRGIYAAVLGLEKKDPSRYGTIISSRYQDEEGNNKLTLLKMIGDVLSDFQPIKCDIKQLTIEIKDKDAAEAVIGFKFYFKALRDQKLYYDAGRIRADFAKEGRAWKMRRLDYMDAKEIYSMQSVS